MTVDEQLIIAAAELMGAAPSAFEKFKATLQLHADVRRNDCIRASTDRIQVAQGRAQEILDLLNTFEKCRTVADRIKKGRP